jgi:hypothetical protein
MNSKKFLIITIIISLIFVIHNYLLSETRYNINNNDVISGINGSWKRADSSVYEFKGGKAILRNVGFELIRGKFKNGDIKIKDIYEKDGVLYGFRRINDKDGNLISWRKVKIEQQQDKIIIRNQDGDVVCELNKILSSTPKVISSTLEYLEGYWKRQNDGSVYKFESDIAVIERVGWALEKGKFQKEQVKIKSIKNISKGEFTGFDRINNSEGNLLRWKKISIYLTENEIKIKSQDSNKLQYLTKIDYLGSDQNEIIAELSQKIDNLAKSKTDNKEEVEKSPVPVTEFAIDIEKNIVKTDMYNPNAIAVVIGNRNYKKKDIPPVEFANRDANFVKEYLINTLGYREGNIIYVNDASQADFNSIFGTDKNHKGKLYNYVKSGKSDVFVYYSGHGAPDPESKNGYFVPVDCDPSLVALNGYLLNTFYKNISKIDYKSLTVVIDACFSGSSEGGMLLHDISPVFIKVENPVTAKENSAIFTSATGEQVSSWYPEKKHSLFTYYFLKALQGEADKNNDKQLTIGEIKDYIDDKVPYKARRLNNREQTPQAIGNVNKVIVEY